MKKFLTKEALFEALKAGNRDAQTELYKNVFPGLCACSYKIVKDKEQAHEIAMDRFWKCLSIVEKIKDYTGLVNVLFTATKRLSLNYVRNNKKNWQEIRMEPVDLDEMPDPDTTNDILQNEMLAFLRLQIASLSGLDHIIAQRAFIEGMSSKEIAALLKISIRSVENRRTRAKAKLRDAVLKVFRN